MSSLSSIVPLVPAETGVPLLPVGSFKILSVLSYVPGLFIYILVLPFEFVILSLKIIECPDEALRLRVGWFELPLYKCMALDVLVVLPLEET